jgi:hypothetical protein
MLTQQESYFDGWYPKPLDRSCVPKSNTSDELYSLFRGQFVEDFIDINVSEV